MDETSAIEKAGVLVEALEWIRRFRDRYVVIKLGGSALDDPASVRAFLTDVIFMETVGMRPILVHGGGKAISHRMQTEGIEPRFVHGRRYTDEKTLDIAADVLCNHISPQIVDNIRAQGGRAITLNHTTQNCLMGERLKINDERGEPLDLGRVGEVTSINYDLLTATCRTNTVPVLPSIAKGNDDQLLNVNADSAAAAVARMLHVEKLIFVSDVPGVFLDRDDPDTLQRHLTIAQCRDFISRGIIDAGMIPKVEAAMEALEAGVRKVHLVDARIPHSILLEIYSNKGIGTEIVKE